MVDLYSLVMSASIKDEARRLVEALPDDSTWEDLMYQIYVRETVEAAPISANGESSDWARLSMESLARAYGEEEPEYPLDLIKEPNPEYEGR